MLTKFHECKNYSVQHEFECEYVKLSNICNIEHFERGDELYIIKVTDNMNAIGDFTCSKKTQHENIVYKEQLDKIISDLSKFSNDPNLGNGGSLYQNSKNDKAVYLLKKEAVDFYRKYGTEQYNYKFSKKDDKTISNFVVKNIFDVISNKNFKEDYVFAQFRETKHNIDYITTSEGENVIPPIKLNYIDGGLDNKNYKLEELTDHLLLHYNIDFIKDGRTNNVINSKTAHSEKDLSGIIQSIPYYNQDDGRTECINIIYYPDKNETDKIIHMTQPLKDINWSRQCLILNEVLGAKNFLVSPPKEKEQPLKNKFR